MARPPHTRPLANDRPARAGVSLVEVLVTISLIAVLAAMLMPALGVAREAARKSSCMANLASIAKGFTAFDAAKGQLPGWRNRQDLYSNTRITANQKTQACVSWTVTVMPYLGEREIFTWYETFTTSSGVDAVTNKRIARYVCPSLAADQKEKYPAAIAYAANAGTAAVVLKDSVKQYRGDGVVIDAVGNLSSAAWYVTQASGGGTAQQYEPSRYSLEAVGSADGESCTALLAERTGIATPRTLVWSSNPLPAASNALSAAEAHVFLQPVSITAGQVYPTDRKTGNTWMKLTTAADRGLRYPTSCHGRGYQLAFCDGHTRTISDSIDPWVYSQLLSSDQATRSPRVQEWEKYRLDGTLVHYILDDKDVDKK